MESCISCTARLSSTIRWCARISVQTWRGSWSASANVTGRLGEQQCVHIAAGQIAPPNHAGTFLTRVGCKPLPVRLTVRSPPLFGVYGQQQFTQISVHAHPDTQPPPPPTFPQPPLHARTSPKPTPPMHSATLGTQPPKTHHPSPPARGSSRVLPYTSIFSFRATTSIRDPSTCSPKLGQAVSKVQKACTHA